MMAIMMIMLLITTTVATLLPFLFTHVEYCDMHYVYGYCDGNASAAYISVGRCSSVGIATRYGLDGPGIEFWSGRDFPQPFRLTIGPNQPPVQRIPGLSRG